MGILDDRTAADNADAKLTPLHQIWAVVKVEGYIRSHTLPSLPVQNFQ